MHSYEQADKPESPLDGPLLDTQASIFYSPKTRKGFLSFVINGSQISSDWMTNAVRMVPVREMATKIFHVAHGTAAVVAEKPLNHKRAQRRVERKVANLFDEVWIKELEVDESLDGLRTAVQSAR